MFMVSLQFSLRALGPIVNLRASCGYCSIFAASDGTHHSLFSEKNTRLGRITARQIETYILNVLLYHSGKVEHHGKSHLRMRMGR